MPSGIRATRPTQRRDRRRGRGDSGGDGEARRRLVLPAVGKRVKQPVAPLGKIDRARARASICGHAS